MQPLLAAEEVERLVGGDCADPFGVLGMHLADGAAIVRALLPQARSAHLLDGPAEGRQLARVHPDGLFEIWLDDVREPFAYRLRVVWTDGQEQDIYDPYAFPPVLSDYDLHLFAEGNHLSIYDRLGAHVQTVSDVAGVLFAVWAPNARRVSVVGDFNQWDGRCHPMRSRGTSGVWELFAPQLAEGALYKYEIRTHSGAVLTKSDPFARRLEFRPQTAALVHRLAEGGWSDAKWLEARAKADGLDVPLSIYEVHLGSWKRVPEEENRPLTYRELALDLVDYVEEMGYTHVELLPVMEHPLDESWGYQVTGYFAPTSRYGPPEDFQFFVDQCHARGIGVLLDWVPAHFPSDAHGLANFDGTALYEHADPRQGFHPDWNTLIFNYGRNEVQNFLIANALYWFEHFHIDGLRVDAVASMLYLDYSRQGDEWLPNRHGGRENLEAIDFMRRLNEVVHARFPGALMIAEESTAWPGVTRPVHLGGLGFGLKWNMGWMHDLLTYISKDPAHRKFHHDALTFSLLYAFHENFALVLSHDEVVHGKGSLLDKMPGGAWEKFANLRLFYTYMYGHPGKKLLFMGGEFGQGREWSPARSLDWHLLKDDQHAGLQRLVRDLNGLYRAEPALYDLDFDPAGFAWIDFRDTDQSVIAFMRRSRQGGPPLVFACNFTPRARTPYRIGVPDPGFYREVLNSDAEYYGGTNAGNRGGLETRHLPCHGHAHSLEISLPPLAVVIFKNDSSSRA